MNRAIKIFQYDVLQGGVNIPYRHLILGGMLGDYSLQTNIPIGTDIEKFLQSLIASPSARAIPQVINNTHHFVHSVETDGYLYPTEVGADFQILLNTENTALWRITFSVINSKGEGIEYNVFDWDYEVNPQGQFLTGKGLVRVKLNQSFLINSSYYGTSNQFQFRQYGIMDVRNKDSQVKYLNVELFPYISESEFSPAGLRKLPNVQTTPYTRVLALCDLEHR